MNEGNQPTQESRTVANARKGTAKTFMVLGVVILLLLAVVGMGVYRAYAKAASDTFTISVAKALHLPAIKVGEDKVLYTDFIEDLKAIHIMAAFDKAQAAVTGQAGPGANLTEEEMKRDVILRLVNNLVAEKAAQRYGIMVEDADVTEIKDKLLAQFTDEAALNVELMKRYGWSFADYEQKVIHPFILQDKLATKIHEDSALKEPVRAEAEKVLEEVKTGGDFSALAETYSDDTSATAGGDLGWFPKGKMVPEFEKAVFSLKKGEVFPTLVETQFGYHIIKLDDRRITRVKNDKGFMVNQEQARASHILFRFVNLASYLDEQIKQSKPKLYIKVASPFEPTDPILEK